MELQFKTILIDAGLSPDQAVVYELLIRLGNKPASELVKALPANHVLSRPQVYKILDELIERGLVEKRDAPGKVATFAVTHPDTLTKTLAQSKAQFDEQYERASKGIPQLTSLFNLTAGKPGVQYFEGKDGLWQVLEDTLTATEEILTYADVEAINTYIPELNAEYVALREDKHVKKRGLVVDTPAARKFLASYTGQVTTTKLIPRTQALGVFQTIIQIYDNKVSYMTMSEHHLIGIIITDQFIANTHKFLFESMWQVASGEVV
jgi:sugar-specific transcriptional regulator TrmB